MENFNKILEDLNGAFNSTCGEPSTGNYWNLSVCLSRYEEELREYIQEITKEDIKAIINKLRTKQELTTTDIEYIKLWLVGEAQYYVKLENNYNDWLVELQRLIDVINKTHQDSPDFETASKLRAYLLDAVRVLGDIVFFLKQAERVKNFIDSTHEIDDEERELLVRLLEGKIRSTRE